MADSPPRSRPAGPSTTKQLANANRLLILEWLRDPVANFPPQQDGDLVRDGVCSLFITDKLGVSQPTCGEHLKILSRAGLIQGTKIKQWVFYRRDEDRIAGAKERSNSAPGRDSASLPGCATALSCLCAARSS